MGTGIEWTDETWNPVTGCTKVSAGCHRCYAETMHERFNGKGSFATVTLHPDRLDKPLHWLKRRKVFVNSMSDLFHKDVPDEFIARVFAVMATCPQHTFQILTKRHGRMQALLSSESFKVMTWAAQGNGRPGCSLINPVWPLPNVWLGVSVENQKTANLRVLPLLDTPAAVRFLSCEPLLGPLDLTHCDYVNALEPDWNQMTGAPHPLIDWVIVGGESGKDAGVRPMHPQWARAIRDQCVEAKVPFLFKQWGEWGPAPWTVRVCDPAVGWKGTAAELAAAKADAEARGATHVYASWADQYGHELYEPLAKPWSGERGDPLDAHQAPMRRWGKKAAGRELDGRIWDEYPAVIA